MSRQPSGAEIHLNNTIACLTPAISLLNELSDAFGTPFVPAISNTTLSLINMIQHVKKNKEDCIQLLENVYQLLCAIVNLHITSETKGNLPPATLDHVGKFTETLHKIHAFVEAQQQEDNKIKYFFRRTETKTLLIECRAGLQQAFEGFKIETGITALVNITQMQQEVEMMHKEVLELIATLSDGTTSDRSSSIYNIDGSLNRSWSKLNFPCSSSNSISMLPAEPKIFHGRETELKDVVNTLHQESPRIAILGPGGIGKTSLAKAVLHHPDIAIKYEQCFFIVADSVTTSITLSVLIAEHIGLKPTRDVTQQVIHYFATNRPALLILDNLDTSWEPIESRSKVEELLAKLTDISHLALMAGLSITMRGAERPAKVQWTHPFLAPLKPLSDLAARDTFFAIAEDVHDSKDVDEVLSLTDNMPLAVDLIAHAVDFEGSCSAVLARWKSEKTSLLSVGNDRKSNLDTSITISLSSSRMSTGAKDLLSLLSILPDGLSDVDLVQSKLSIQNIMTCKATLLATSLAYIDDKRHLKSLVPIREHMQCFYPPAPLLLHPLQKYFHQLLDLHHQYPRTQQGAGRIRHLASNVRNMCELLLRGLNQNNPNLPETINCTFSLQRFMPSVHAGYFHLISMLMDQIAGTCPGNCNEKVEAQLITWKFESRSPHLSTHADLLITQAVSHFHAFNDLALEWRFYLRVGVYYFQAERKVSVAQKYLHKALDLAKLCGDIRQEALILNTLAQMELKIGDYGVAQKHAQASHRLAELAGDLHCQSMALRTSALCYQSFGDINNTILFCQRARKLRELCGTTTGSTYITILLQDLAEAQLRKSEYVEARNIYTQLARDAVAAQEPYNDALCLLNIAQLDIMMGASKQDVLWNLDKAMALFDAQRYGYYSVMSAKTYCNIELGKLHLREGEIRAAKEILQTGFHSTWGNDTECALSCMESLANISCWPECDFYWAAGWTVAYLGYAKKLGDKIALHRALQFLGDVIQAEGDSTTSTSLFTVALEGFTCMDIHRSRAECMLRLGDLAKGQGDLLKAIELWSTARLLFERSSQAKQVTQMDERLAAITNNVLQETTDSLMHLGQLNAPVAVAPEETYTGTQAGEMKGGGGKNVKFEWVNSQANSPLPRTYDTEIYDKAGKWGKTVSLKTRPIFKTLQTQRPSKSSSKI
ncbi:hypothetical protein FB451DRAFT_1365343 [Mycena latifolia]|nr:hypothetical protein FB451DRAFT_1365343 [Mycena latifolia]